MQKHFVHFALIIMLAIAPMQSVLAGLAALEHATACETGSMSGSEHAGMDHSSMSDKDSGKSDTQCSCCADCLAMCSSVAKPTGSMDVTQIGSSLSTELAFSRYSQATSSLHPPTDIRPPIALL